MAGSPIYDQVLRQFEQYQDSLNLNDFLHSENDSTEEACAHSFSPYLSIEQCFEELPSKKDQFSVLSLNAQSLAAKFDQLSAVLSELSNRDFIFSAICIQETWHRKGDNLSFFEIPGYQIIEQGRICSAHGGLLIYLHESFSFNVNTLYSQSDLWEGIFIDITSERMKKKLTLGNIYRPPKFNNSNTTIDTFLEEIRPILLTLSKSNCDVICTGDFNIDLLEMHNREKYQEFFDLFSTNSFFPKNNTPNSIFKKKGYINRPDVLQIF